MTTVLQLSEMSDVDSKCRSYSRSRARYCLAYGRYACPSPTCGHRSCGLHVIRNDRGMFCPQCSGPVKPPKH